MNLLGKIKKKNILIFFLILVFIYGYGLGRYEFFPHKELENLKIKIFQNEQQLKTIELKQIEIDEKSAKEIYKNWSQLNENFTFPVKKYHAGLNIFLDRHYINHKNDDKLKNFYLIQIPRHFRHHFTIKVLNEIIVYRAVCQKNFNKYTGHESEFNNYIGWETENFVIAIIGDSCIHSKLVKKKFKKGVHKFKPGGPYSSDPFFVDNLNYDKPAFEIEKILNK
jgi:hypothetical protein|tara:strand:+ start:238 stop:906 length:669 start_codon:yes stop_codon:yes gene_type:complete